MLKVGTHYVWMVIGPWCWGKGETLTEAMKKAGENGSKEALKKNHAVYLTAPDVYLNSMGDFCWPDGRKESPPVVKVKVVRGGKEIAPENWDEPNKEKR